MAEKKNYWAAIIAFVLLIILPVGSYLYLKKGFAYRKQSIVEMTKIDSLDWSKYQIRHGMGQDDILTDKIVVSATIGHEDDLIVKAKTIQALHNQFGTRKEVKFILAYRDSVGYSYFTEQDILDDIFVLTSYRDQTLSVEQLTLIDQTGNVRGYYTIGNLAEMQKLVRHIAVLLPLEQKKKLDLIRKSD